MISTSYDIFDLDDSEFFPSIHEGKNYRLPKAKLMGKEMHQGRGSLRGTLKRID
jgi:hypothetical protein